MFLLWEHAVLSLFNYIVFVWLFLLVVLWLPLPDRPEERTLNMAGFRVRSETRSSAPAWLDAGRVTGGCIPAAAHGSGPGQRWGSSGLLQRPTKTRPPPPRSPSPAGSCWEHIAATARKPPAVASSPRPRCAHHVPAAVRSWCRTPAGPTGCPKGEGALCPPATLLFIFLCPPCYFKGIPEDAVRLGCGLVGLFVFVLEVL